MPESTTSEFIISPEVIKTSPLGLELSDAQCRRLARVVSASGLRQGELLFEEGHRDDALHVITRGNFEVVKAAGGGDMVSLHVLGEGDMIGRCRPWRAKRRPVVPGRRGREHIAAVA
jgi:signal-transduction protein with cAMP-binding, CBS, and nucleotidyltransferase domain